MTARCGSNDPEHRAKTCRACDRLYKRRYKAGQPRFRYRVTANAATCRFCGLVAGNSMNIPVYRYPLKRHVFGVKQQAWIGTLGLCDRCIVDNAELKPKYRGVAA